jgi:hypothetical protein
MDTNEARMCRKLFHFSNILAALEFEQTHIRIATESQDSDHILPCQSLGLSHSELVKYQPHNYIVYILYWVLRGPSESEDGGVSVTNVRVSEYPLIAGKPI